MWDGFQCEMLDALGLTPLVLAPRQLPDDALLRALLRAAGRDAHAHDLDTVLHSLPPTTSLRGDASAKRALWPQVRHARRALP